MERKIVFLSQFSEQRIRTLLRLKKYGFRKIVAKIRGIKYTPYQDYAIWVSEYLSEFEKHSEYEFHFVGPHRGMMQSFQEFELNGIHYHFFKNDGNYIYDLFNSRYRLEEKQDYKTNRGRIKRIIESINPDLIILCGAENPNYALAVTDLEGIPVYVILQTLLNAPKRIEMGVGTAYRRRVELEVFKTAQYFCTSDKTDVEIITRQNAKAKFLPAGFPTHRPSVEMPNKKDYDFVFFSRNVTVYKGIEELLKALSILKEKHECVSLNIIGGVEGDYRCYLDNQIREMKITENVSFAGYYTLLDDTYKNVVKAKAVVVPGITAALNSTVREAMLIGMPTICFESAATNEINKEEHCLLTAKMEDSVDLSFQMERVLTCPNEVRLVAENGHMYAERFFSNEAIVNKLLKNCEVIFGNR